MSNIYLAFILDCILGDPYWFPHPVRFIGKYISFFEKQIRKANFKDITLKIGGVFLTLSTIGLTYGICFGILKAAYIINPKIYYVLNIVILWTCIAPKCLSNEAIKIYKELVNNNIEKSRKQLSYIVGRDTDNLDESEITRAVVETVGENTSDGIIAPLMYMFIGGAPLALTYKAVNTLDSMVGYKEDIYLNFGWFSAKLDDVVNYIPARLTALFMVISSFILRFDYKNCIKIINRDKNNHTSPNAGYPESAMAGALRVKIGGTNSYFGKLTYKPTIGDELKKLEKEDIRKSTILMYGTTIVSIVIFSIILISCGLIH
ncbi:cobalamin biosynthesis protein CobD [Clostridium botulinum]|uniref:Cobalamin biosynthesis protein CobD n=1 Tax=Clostridium botulinum TaxID=1491 RepID=A0A9Q1UWN5_CLOBO|nr:cobalamin biosynthesis protein [Clostridium botulinum]AEB76065.1 cobalamin biosynthesis protein CobD [Clostridium botulinum BKT015925]KEI04120.1 cobalamin biosynthesis protein CobD [Clostridium botulinum C/D str. Sp77]KOA76327.1 cobalamin biosynthesis protein CobD [Clostridium botulinum]KOA83125.1 cobalamin biosynthesis protein CobD [Clostridium botulinum]KOA85819.1 cobalamin biosynthesis protein CobD [Clostridium botulinum]